MPYHQLHVAALCFLITTCASNGFIFDAQSTPQTVSGLVMSQLQTLQAELKHLQSDVQSKNDETYFLKQDVRKLNQSLNSELPHLRQQQHNLSANYTSLKAQYEALKLESARKETELLSRLNATTASMNSLDQMIVSMNQTSARHVHDTEALRTTLRLVESNNALLHKNVDILNQTLYIERNERAALQTEIQRLNTDYQRLQSQHETLKNESQRNHAEVLGRLKSSASKVDGLEGMLNMTNQQSMRNQHDLSFLSGNISGLSSRLQDVDMLNQSQQALINQMNNTARQLRTIQLDFYTKTYFSATFPVSTVKVNEPVKFIGVLSNIPSGSFDTAAGRFVCPRSGLYFLSTTLVKTADNSVIACWIMKNDEKLVSSYSEAASSDQSHDASRARAHISSSNGVFVELVKGDRAWVGNCSGDGSLDSSSSFTGALITPDV